MDSQIHDEENNYNKSFDATNTTIYLTPISTKDSKNDTNLNDTGPSTQLNNVQVLHESTSTALIDDDTQNTLLHDTEKKIVLNDEKKNTMKQIPDICQTQRYNNYFDRLSEAETEYLDFTKSPIKCSDYDENCFCQNSEDMSSSVSASFVNERRKKKDVQVIKREFSANKRMIKVRIKTSAVNECSVEGEPTENGIKICISPRIETYKSAPVPVQYSDVRPVTTCIMNETFSVASSKKITTTTTTEIDSSELETDYEFRKNLKNELKHSPAANKVLKYLESLSEMKKKSSDNPKAKSKRKSKEKNINTFISGSKETLCENVVHATEDKLSDKPKLRKSKSRYSKRASQYSGESVEDEEFHDCCDRTVTSTDTNSSLYEDTTDNFNTSQSIDPPSSVQDKEEAPLLTITQEMSAEMVVTSKVEVNKEKLRRMNEKRKKMAKQKQSDSPEKIIDENFCNEILDQMNKSLEKQKYLNDSELNQTTDSTASLNQSIGPKKPPRTFTHSPAKYSSIFEPDSSECEVNLNEELKKLKLIQFHQRRSIESKDIDDDNYVVGWTSPKSLENKESHAHQMGWAMQPEVPLNIANMLHYSDDEILRHRVLSSNARAGPQQPASVMHPSSSLGPKLNIDTVDAPVNVTPTSSNHRFEQFSMNAERRSTPRKRSGQGLMQRLDSDQDVKRLKEICKTFLEMERLSTTKKFKGLPTAGKNIILKSNQFKLSEPEVAFDGSKRTRDVCKQFLKMERAATTKAFKPLSSTRGKAFEWRPKSYVPHQKPVSNGIKRTKDTCNQFLNMERLSTSKASLPLPSKEFNGKQNFCSRCSEKRTGKEQRFHQRALKRTKSLIDASKKKISGLRARSHRFNTSFSSESVRYATPEKNNTPSKSSGSSVPQRDSNTCLAHSAETVLASEMYPPVPPQRTKRTFNSNAPLPQSPRKTLWSSPLKSPLHLKMNFSPKKFFSSHHTAAPTTSPAGSPLKISNQGTYQAFSEPDRTATMGEILSQLRSIIEGDALAKKQQLRQRKASTSSEVLYNSPAGKSQTVDVQLHYDPEYSEISPVKRKLKKSPLHVQRIEHNNNEYIIVNNDPNAIYATVIKRNKTTNSSGRSRSLNNINTHTIAEGSMEDVIETPTKNNTKRISFNIEPSSSQVQNTHELDLSKRFTVSEENLAKNQFPIKNNSAQKMDTNKNISRNLFGAKFTTLPDIDPNRMQKMQHEKFVQKSKQLAHSADVMDEYLASLTNILSKKLVVNDKNIEQLTDEFLLKEIQEEEATREKDDTLKGAGNALVEICQGGEPDRVSNRDTYRSYGYLSPSDGKLSDDGGERSFSLKYEGEHDVIRHENESGYDMVDYKQYEDPTVLEVCEADFVQYYNLDDKRQITSLDDTLTTSTTENSGPESRSNSVHVSPVKMRHNNSNNRNNTLYRSFKNSLRSSFRKGRNFIKHEQDKLVHLFEKNTPTKNAVPKPARSSVTLDEYKKFYCDRNAEQIYQEWCDKLRQPNSQIDLMERKMLHLISTITTQRTIKKQLRSALAICRNSKEFDCSPELVEAERLLLVSNLKEAVAKKELIEIEKTAAYADIQQPPPHLGTIAFSEFEFPLKDAALYDTFYNYFYVCVATYKDSIKASYAKEREGNKVCFQNFEIKFWEVEADYQIKIEVFVLSLRKTNRGAGEGRLMSSKNTSKLSPRRIFSSSDKTPPKPYTSESEFSQFKSQGFVYITAASFMSYTDATAISGQFLHGANIDFPYYSSSNFNQYLKKSGSNYVHCIEDYRTFRLNQMIYNSHLNEQLKMGIKSEVTFAGTDISGFLTVGESINGSIVWNRRWCKAEGLTLNFWNYPQEASEKPPIETIDISKCENDRIYQADRSICPRPRAIVIELPDTSSLHNSKTGYNFLVTDTNHELKNWLRELNKMLQFVRDWRV